MNEEGGEALSLDSRVSPSGHAVFREVDGEGVVLDSGSGTYFGLDSVGTRVWKLIESHGALRPVFDTVLAEYDVAPKQLKQDLLALVTQLVDKGLVTRR